MWINLLHRIFGSDRNLNRQEIDGYLDGKLSNQERNKVEQKMQSSEFDADAMDGYAQAGAKTRELTRLDRKFNGGLSYRKLIIGGFLLLLSIMIVVVVLQNTEVTNEIATNTTASDNELNHFIEEEEIALPMHIDSLIESEKEIISNDDLAKTPKHSNENKPLPTIKTDEEESNDVVHTMPTLNQIPEFENVVPSVALRNYSKELYLSELKFIDFRGERLRPIKVKGLVTIGTSADLEQKGGQSEHIDWEEKEITYHDYLVKTAKLLKSGSYKKALQRLETILVHYPTDENALFYSGLCYYNLGQYNVAIDKWDKSMQSFRQNFYEEIIWYTLKSHQRLVNKNRLQEYAQRVVAENGFYTEQAKEILKKK